MGELQELLSLVDILHLPSSFYSIQTSTKDSSLTQDWVNGMLFEGKNLICRVIPPTGSNRLSLEWIQNQNDAMVTNDVVGEKGRLIVSVSYRNELVDTALVHYPSSTGRPTKTITANDDC